MRVGKSRERFSRSLCKENLWIHGQVVGCFKFSSGYNHGGIREMVYDVDGSIKSNATSFLFRNAGPIL